MTYNTKFYVPSIIFQNHNSKGKNGSTILKIIAHRLNNHLEGPKPIYLNKSPNKFSPIPICFT